MDIFDKYLFDEITALYAEENLTSDDYEELYKRFLIIDYLPKTKPYLLAMRYLELGTPDVPECVMEELETILG